MGICMGLGAGSGNSGLWVLVAAARMGAVFVDDGVSGGAALLLEPPAPDTGEWEGEDEEPVLDDAEGEHGDEEGQADRLEAGLRLASVGRRGWP